MSGVEMVPTHISPRANSHSLVRGKSYGFSQNVSYYNNFSKDVKIGLRNGLVIDIPTDGDFRAPREFIIILEYSFSHEVYERLQFFLHSHDVDSNPCLVAIRDNLNRDGYGKYSTRKSRIEYAITEAEFLEKGSQIFIHDLDIVLSSKSKRMVHPYSPEGAMYRTAISYHNNDDCFFIEYIKETDDCRPLFIRIAGQVIQIDPKHSEVYPPGLYFRANNVKNGPIGDPDKAFVVLDVNNLEELHEHGFYKNYDEAANGPDMEVKQKLELVEAQAELTRNAAVLEKLKQSLEMERLEYKRILAIKESELKESQLAREQLSSAMNDRLADEQALRKARQAEYLDRLEERSAVRKEQTEVIKYIPSFILGLGAAFVALKSFLK